MAMIACQRWGRHSARVIRTNFLDRPAGLALCLVALSVTAGCAHFHNAEVRASQQRAQFQPPVPPPAQAESMPPAALPSVAPAPVAVPQASPVPPGVRVAAPEPVEQKSPEQLSPSKRVALAAPPQTPAAAEPVPAPIVPVPAAPRPADPAPRAVAASGNDSAVIVFANSPGAHCGSCETLKISVAPSGQVLIERGYWAENHSSWRYKRSVAHVGATRAAAFAASLSGNRPDGAQALAGIADCPGPVGEQGGLAIEWIEAERHDRLTVNFSCPPGRNSPTAEQLRHAPELLGLRQIAVP